MFRKLLLGTASLLFAKKFIKN